VVPGGPRPALRRGARSELRARQPGCARRARGAAVDRPRRPRPGAAAATRAHRRRRVRVRGTADRLRAGRAERPHRASRRARAGRGRRRARGDRRGDGHDRRPAGIDAPGRRLRPSLDRGRSGRLMAVRTLDPITTEIIRSAFSAAADEMNATLIRSAYTPVIYEMKDFSVALLDAEHRVLGQSAGLPIFLGNLEICTRITEQMYGREAWKPGDIWIMNDSYLTGTHLNDMTVF